MKAIDKKLLRDLFTMRGQGLAIGAVVGGIWAKKVEMTGMPELVALFNGFGGIASLLVGWAERAGWSEGGESGEQDAELGGLSVADPV